MAVCHVTSQEKFDRGFRKRRELGRELGRNKRQTEKSRVANGWITLRQTRGRLPANESRNSGKRSFSLRNWVTVFICGTAKKYERQRFFHRFGQAISEKSSRMEYQFGDDFLLQDADPVGEKTNKGFWKTSWLRYSGKRRHRCIGKRRHRCAANEGKDVPANGRRPPGDNY